MLLVSMRDAHVLMGEIDGFNFSMKEVHATQELSDRADNVGDVEIIGGHFVQHGGEEEKIVVVDEGDI